jgi:ketosteroid isomerase-like protein
MSLSKDQAQRLAEEWYAGWNAHDLERILSHYSEEIVFISPFAVEIAGHPYGGLEGKQALRDYFGAALERFPNLEFEPIALTVGIDSLVLHYRSVKGLLAAELMIVDEGGKVTEVLAHYGEGDSR